MNISPDHWRTGINKLETGDLTCYEYKILNHVIEELKILSQAAYIFFKN